MAPTSRRPSNCSDDLGNIASIGGTDKGERIKYKAPGRRSSNRPIPPVSPHPSRVSSTTILPGWNCPRKPRQRLIAEADIRDQQQHIPLASGQTASASSAGPSVASGGKRAADGSAHSKRGAEHGPAPAQAYQEARTIQQGAYSDRRPLSLGPAPDLPQPAESPPQVGDLGEA